MRTIRSVALAVLAAVLLPVAGVELSPYFADKPASAPKLSARAILQGPEPAVGLYWVFSGDPTTGAGICAPQWQLGFRTDNNTLYYHSGVGCTAWTVFAAGGGAISSITCLTGLTCTPNPITATGTIANTGPGGSGSAGYYAAWITASTLGIQNIDDEGSFGNTTRFFNTYNRFDHGVYSYNGDFIAGENPLGDGGGFGSGRLLSYYSVGNTLGGGSANILAEDLEPVSNAPGTGGNIQFFGNIANTSGGGMAFAAEWKASKTTSTISDDTFDLIGSTTAAGVVVEVCKLGHDGSLTVPNGPIIGDDGETLSSPSIAAIPLTVNNANLLQVGNGSSVVVSDTGTYNAADNNTDAAIYINNTSGQGTHFPTKSFTAYGIYANVASAGTATNTTNYAFYAVAGQIFGGSGATFTNTATSGGVGQSVLSVTDQEQITGGTGATTFSETVFNDYTLAGTVTDTAMSVSSEAQLIGGGGTVNTVGLSVGGGEGNGSNVAILASAAGGSIAYSFYGSAGIFYNAALVDLGAHVETTGTATTALTSCGTGSPSIATGSTDVGGQFTEGTTAAGCTMTFKGTYTNSPFCVCTAKGAAATACDASGSTATSLVVTNASATGTVITYWCTGRSGGT